MSRMTDNDRSWGPFTLARWKGNFSVEWLSHAAEHEKWNQLRIIAFGWALRIWLPRLLQPWRIRHEANWDAATVNRLGRNFWYEEHQRVFGFSLSNQGNGYDFLQIHYGARTMDSSTDKTWSKFLPWKQYRHVRTSMYDLNGDHFFTEAKKHGWDEWYRMTDVVPKAHFAFSDYDGQKIIATTHITEREWTFGTGWFKWLGWFRKHKVCRSLDLKFSEEVGTEKGSWKGGTIGHSIDMLPGELHEAAFRRYCDKEQRGRGGRTYRLKFIGPCDAPPPKPKHVESAANEANCAAK